MKTLKNFISDKIWTRVFRSVKQESTHYAVDVFVVLLIKHLLELHHGVWFLSRHCISFTIKSINSSGLKFGLYTPKNGSSIPNTCNFLKKLNRYQCSILDLIESPFKSNQNTTRIQFDFKSRIFSWVHNIHQKPKRKTTEWPDQVNKAVQVTFLLRISTIFYNELFKKVLLE